MLQDEKLQNNKPMTEAEQSEALDMLKEGLKRGVFSYEHADPIAENCYISSGYIEGLYFPNTTLKLNALKHFSYDICCIANINGVLSLVYTLKDDTADNLKRALKEFISDPLESLIYSYDERKIRSELISRIKDHEKNAEFLAKIKRVYKKNGEDFTDLFKCFEGIYSLTISREYVTNIAHTIKINDYYMSRNEADREHEPTAEEIEALIKKHLEAEKGYIKQYKTALKNTARNFAKLQKLTATCKDFLMTLKSGEFYTFRKQLVSMIESIH